MKKISGLVLAVIFLCTWQWAIQDARLLRFPNISNDLVVFVYAGDIWSVPAAGGDARRLTSHPGLELFPKISPDGRWIAFSAEYSGSRQVYVMASAGGTPRQLTYYNDAGIMPPRGGYDYVIMDWTPDSSQILVRCNRTPWGGLIGISGNPDFADGGSFNVPAFGFVDTDGNWAVEGEGVYPDIEVIDRPELVAAGKDPCVEKAVQVLLEELGRNPAKKMVNPAAPDRSKWIEKEIK